ncbi:hypothetical protein F1D05_02510 [Kribbella qitaiheensis]|uniref:Uncharacterized protein n=1 Tax=Kribbella qitaiheensis TaxID=1544730 RepID=A0A7G6WSL9_9ACTN|nr:hypothetical protein [Kribbella qitaiheensis]QNE16984.1 hypothetical protein F1D05_02510 [Kribbella qitaiheensis]
MTPKQGKANRTVGRMPKKPYERELLRLQAELVKLQESSARRSHSPRAPPSKGDQRTPRVMQTQVPDHAAELRRK